VPSGSVSARECSKVIQRTARAVRAEIADALVGMGSIHDAYLEPLPGSGLSETRCEEKRNALVERIGLVLRSPP
jgi:hypothetical protein